MTPTLEQIRRAPKVLLHDHLDGGLRPQTIIDLAAEVGHVLPAVDGPMTAVGTELADHAEAVTTEAVSNALRHSGASRLTVEISVADVFTLNVIDDGCGIPAGNTRHSGVGNMKRRAEQLGGTCEITRPPKDGTRVHWVAPLIDP